MLRKGRLKDDKKTGFEDTSPDPMSYMANLSDAMLVLACGLMAALILYWKVDLKNSRTTDLSEKNIEKIDVSEVEEKDEEISMEGYKTKIVYADPKTGDLYIIDGSK